MAERGLCPGLKVSCPACSPPRPLRRVHFNFGAKAPGGSALWSWPESDHFLQKQQSLGQNFQAAAFKYCPEKSCAKEEVLLPTA